MAVDVQAQFLTPEQAAALDNNQQSIQQSTPVQGDPFSLLMPSAHAEDIPPNLQVNADEQSDPMAEVNKILGYKQYGVLNENTHPIVAAPPVPEKEISPIVTGGELGALGVAAGTPGTVSKSAKGALNLAKGIMQASPDVEKPLTPYQRALSMYKSAQKSSGNALTDMNAKEKAIEVLKRKNPLAAEYRNNPLFEIIPTPEQIEVMDKGKAALGGNPLETTAIQRMNQINFNTSDQASARAAMRGEADPIKRWLAEHARGQYVMSPYGQSIPRSLVEEFYNPELHKHANLIKQAEEDYKNALSTHYNAFNQEQAAKEALKGHGQNAIGNIAEKAGKALRFVPALNFGLGAAGAGFAGQEAYNRFMRGDRMGAILPAVESLGSAATMFPNPLVSGVGAGVALGAGGLDYLLHRQPEQPAQGGLPKKP